jgi:hypothetical protein
MPPTLLKSRCVYPPPSTPHDLCLFRSTITFASCFMMRKSQGGGDSQNGGLGLGYCLVLGSHLVLSPIF